MTQYFIKRAFEVIGPVTEEQIVLSDQNKSFRETDEVSTSPEGPWTPASEFMTSYFEAIKNDELFSISTSTAATNAPINATVCVAAFSVASSRPAN